MGFLMHILIHFPLIKVFYCISLFGKGSEINQTEINGKNDQGKRKLVKWEVKYKEYINIE
jgi:hypothetical protein